MVFALLPFGVRAQDSTNSTASAGVSTNSVVLYTNVLFSTNIVISTNIIVSTNVVISPRKTVDATNAPAKKEPVTKAPALLAKPQWESTLAFGMTVTKGNSDTILLDSAFKTHRLNLTNEVTALIEGTYGKNDSVKNNETLHGLVQYNHLFTEHLYGYLLTDGFHDAIANIYYRLTVSPGLGYYFIKEKNRTLGVEAGPSFVYEKLDGEYKTYSAARGAERFDQKIDDHTHIWQSAEILPQVDELRNFIVNAELGIETALSKRISLRVVLQDNYVNEPAPGRKKNDVKLISGLTYKF